MIVPGWLRLVVQRSCWRLRCHLALDLTVDLLLLASHRHLYVGNRAHGANVLKEAKPPSLADPQPTIISPSNPALVIRLSSRIFVMYRGVGYMYIPLLVVVSSRVLQAAAALPDIWLCSRFEVCRAGRRAGSCWRSS